MKIKVTVKTMFYCTLERAFKTPMLCDVSKVHTGFGLMPKVTHSTEDENWGKVGFGKKVFAAKSLTQRGGFVSTDKVLDRSENKYWKIEVGNFQTWMLSFYKFVGEWKTTEIEPNEVLVEYTYFLYFSNPILYPLNWLFAKLFWKTYMKKVIENIKELVKNNEPYLYE